MTSDWRKAAADIANLKRGVTWEDLLKLIVSMMSADMALEERACVGCGNAIHHGTDHPVNEDEERPCSLCTCQQYAPPIHRFRPCAKCAGSPDIHNANRGADYIGHEYA